MFLIFGEGFNLEYDWRYWQMVIMLTPFLYFVALPFLSVPLILFFAIESKYYTDDQSDRFSFWLDYFYLIHYLLGQGNRMKHNMILSQDIFYQLTGWQVVITIFGIITFVESIPFSLFVIPVDLYTVIIWLRIHSGLEI